MSHFLLFFCLGWIVFLCACWQQREVDVSETRVPQVISEEKTASYVYTFAVSNMACPACASKIYDAVVAVEEVVNVEIDVESKIVKVGMESPNREVYATLFRAVQEIGYVPKEIEG